jgi:hypothetical protein
MISCPECAVAIIAAAAFLLIVLYVAVKERGKP